VDLEIGLLLPRRETWVGAGLVTSGCKGKDSSETRPYTLETQNSLSKMTQIYITLLSGIARKKQ